MRAAKAESHARRRVLDDFGREPVPFVADFLHTLGY